MLHVHQALLLKSDQSALLARSFGQLLIFEEIITTCYTRLQMNRLDCGSSGYSIMLSVKCVPFRELHLPAWCCELQHSDIDILAALVKAKPQTEIVKMPSKTSLDVMNQAKFHQAPCELHALPLPAILTLSCCTMCKVHTPFLPPFLCTQ